MASVREVAKPMPERLAAAAVDVADAQAALTLARSQRNQLVRQAVDDEGMSQRTVAAAAGITVPRVSAILAMPDDDDQP